MSRRYAGDDADLDELTRRFDQVQLAFGPHPSTYTGRVLQALSGVPARHGETGGGTCLVELGCGTATALAEVTSRDSRVRCVGVEADPVLLRLAQRRRGVDVVEGDFRGQTWLRSTGLTPGQIDVVLAARALHYPDPDEVAGTYDYLGRWLRVGGMLVNADRFPDDPDAEPSATGRAALAAWSQWWVAARSCPALAEAFHARDGRAPLETGNRLTATDHVRLLQSAAFSAVQVVDLGGGDMLVIATR